MKKPLLSDNFPFVDIIQGGIALLCVIGGFMFYNQGAPTIGGAVVAIGCAIIVTGLVRSVIAPRVNERAITWILKPGIRLMIILGVLSLATRLPAVPRGNLGVFLSVCFGMLPLITAVMLLANAGQILWINIQAHEQKPNDQK